MDVAVVTVGDELLSGDTANSNATWLGRRLTDRGATVGRVVVIPDEPGEIASTVHALADRYDAVVVTGGLGPTHDDVTMEAIADAFDRDFGEHPDAVSWFETEASYSGRLDPGTTHLPVDARLLPNDVGVAPGAVVEHTPDSEGGSEDAETAVSFGNVYVLPGVPSEMKAMFERIAGEFTGERRHVETVHVDAPESALVESFTELQDRFDVTVGSYPGDGVRVKIQSLDSAVARRAADWFRDRVDDDYR